MPGTTKRFPAGYLALDGESSIADAEREVDDITDSVGAHTLATRQGHSIEAEGRAFPRVGPAGTRD